jgi:putative transposase
LLIGNIKFYQEKYKFAILGYVIMPSHFHWIISTVKEYGTISVIMREIKKYSAWDIMDFFETQGRIDYLEIFEIAGKRGRKQKRKFWNDRFDDVVINSKDFFFQKLNYIHNNPVKADLVENPEDYKYSSARNYKFGDHSVIYVETDVL